LRTRWFPSEVQGYKGLAELPFFEIQDGRLKVVVQDLPASIDFHTHLGMVAGPATIDYLWETPEVHYLIDCDGTDPPCTFDMTDYVNGIATEEMLAQMEREVLIGGLFGKGSIQTHTLPNLAAEMDDMKFDKAVLLPIAMNLLKPDDMTERWKDAVDKSEFKERFIVLCSVHPKDPDAITKLGHYKDQGYIGIKFHPMTQRISPDDEASMELFEECDKLGMMVFMHAGPTGIEPEIFREHLRMEKYVAPVETFPEMPFVFGHSGARDWEGALKIAMENENVWLGIHGQSVPHLRTTISQFDNERLLFGSDWPFYPLAASLAKVLIVCDGRKALRDKILVQNAQRLLARFLTTPA
jgi:predicted TIM-barrel fold metal-dependent hydrolase